MPAAPAPKLPFDLKSTAWTVTALRVFTADAQALSAALDARFGDTPGLFEDEALVIDLSALPAEAPVPDFEVLLAALRRHRLLPVAVQGGRSADTAAARAAGLAEATDPATGWADTRPEPTAAEGVHEAPADPAAEAAVPAPAPVPQPVPAPEAPAARPTLVVDKPLRSGQRVYARGGDLIVMDVVSFGAEVIADGHIHVYAPLRGRAIAGARGDTSARIFSTCMEPQLVSIAGIYRTTETPLPEGITGRPAQVRLEGESLRVEPLGC